MAGYYRGAGVLFYVAGVHGRPPRVLLGKRAGRPSAGCWSPFGGGREPADRTDADTAEREAREETGVTSERLGLAGDLLGAVAAAPSAGFVIPWVYRWRTFAVRLPAEPSAEWPEPSRYRTEFTDVGWFDVDALPRPLSWATRYDLLRLRQTLRNG